MTSDANGTYRGVYTYGLERISESDQVAVEGVPNDPLYYLYDGRGSVTQLTNTANNVRDKYRYTPYGVPMPGGELSPNTRLFNNPYGYNGEDYDIESGLQFLRARYYNPDTARFVSRDSYLGDVMEPLSLNRYAYTSNNPVMNIDPSGHKLVSHGEEYSSSSSYSNTSSQTTTSSTQILIARDSDDKSNVSKIQTMLGFLDYYLGPTGADGDFGDFTYDAVVAFQKDYNLKPDGKVGPKTFSKLNEVYNAAAGIGLSPEKMAIPKNNTASSGTSSNYANSKIADTRVYNDVGCGFVEGLNSKVPTISEIYNNMVSKEKSILYIDGTPYIKDNVVIGNKDIESRINEGVENATTLGERLQAGIKSTLYRYLKNYNINKYEYIANTTPADMSLEQGEMAVDLAEGQVLGSIVASGADASSYVKNILKETKVVANAINIDEIAPLLKTKPNTAFFWSGTTDGVGGAEKAAQIAKANGGTTLESMIADKNIKMPEWNFNDPNSIKAWEDVSDAYAKQVSGEVRAVVGKQLRQGNIWENVELPRLKANPNVAKITTIDPVTGVKTVIFER